MPQFRYEVTDKVGKPMRGVMDAPSEGEVHQRLVTRGYAVKVVVPVAGPVSQRTPQASPRATNPQATTGPTFGTSAPAKEMAVFFRSLASYLKSGIAIHQALVQMGTQSPNRAMRFICERMAARVQAGQSLSTAMMEFPRAFPPNTVGVTMAGELGGFLPVVIGDVALDYELAQRATMRYGRIINWFLWINALAALPFMLIPTAIFGPGVTDIKTGLMRGLISGFTFIGIPLVVLVTAYFIAGRILKQPAMRPVAHRWLLKVPQVGRASRERSLASFTRILWRLQNAGIQPIQSWDAASRSAENMVISRRLYGQLGAVQSGVPFSQAMAATGLFTSEDQRVLATGEATGQVPDILQRIAAYYEDAAQFSAGRAKWLGLRAAIFANIVSFGIVSIATANMYPAIMRWAEEFIPAP